MFFFYFPGFNSEVYDEQAGRAKRIKTQIKVQNRYQSAKQIPKCKTDIKVQIRDQCAKERPMCKTEIKVQNIQTLD